MSEGPAGTIWTIGHSTLEWDAFVASLRAAGPRRLIDIRSFPGSRRYPQFNRESMEVALKGTDVEYRWMKALGGRRRPRKDSLNTAWRHEAFRGYADYMETTAFADALAELEAAARERPTAYLCSEAVWWRCHRGLVSDALKARGWNVLHIAGGSVKPHPYTPVARVENGRLTYREASLF